MSSIQHTDNEVQKGILGKNVSPFKDWDKLHPNPELQHWRKANEPTINDALHSKKQLEALVSKLGNDVCTFCYDCDSVKCYGSIFPVCEPILKKLISILE